MMSSSNKAYSRRINLREVLFFLQLLVKFQLPVSFVFSATKQILLEVLNSHYKARRPFLQPILFFDKFISELSFHKPRYASFFTNHVAGVMHRFWHYTYPADFSRNFPNSFIKKRHIIKAMDIVDRQLSSLTQFCQNNNYDLWVLSSMGQEPLADYIEISELVLEEPSKLLSFFGFHEHEIEVMPSMHPDLNIRCDSQDTKARIKLCLESLQDVKGNTILPILYDTDGLTLNFSIFPSQLVADSGSVTINDTDYSLSQFGFIVVKRQRASAYHHPVGTFLFHGDRSANLANQLLNNKTLDTTKIHDLVLSFFNIRS